MSSFLQKVQDNVTRANSVNDLTSIMGHIPLESLKDFINESVKLMNHDKIRSIYFETTSIDDIISSDVLQCALSYVPHQKTTKYVSKSFKKATEKNEAAQARSREQIISSQFKGKNVWNVRQENDSLKLQKNKEPEILIKKLDDVFNLVEFGDKLLIHEGSYGLHYQTVLDIESIQIEGIGRCVFCSVNKKRTHTNMLELLFYQTMSIKNIIFEDTFVKAMDNGCVYLTDCLFKNWGGAWVEDEGKLDCSHCKFWARSGFDSLSSVLAEGPCSVSVIDCVFDHCAGRCDSPAINLEESEKVKLKLIGNTFKNLNCSPIGYRSLDLPYACQRCTVNKDVVIAKNTVEGIQSESPDPLRLFLNY